MIFSKSEKVHANFRSCDSYNTAQMQILSGAVPTAEDVEAEGITETPVPESSDMLQVDRGRHTHATEPLHRTISAVDGPPHPAYQRRAYRSASPTLLATLPTPPSTDHRVDTPGHRATAQAILDDVAMDTDDDEEIVDDVDFWGLESPSRRGAQPKSDAREIENIDDSDEDDEDEDEDDDELMDDELEEDDEAEDHMAIYGHR